MWMPCLIRAFMPWLSWTNSLMNSPQSRTTRRLQYEKSELRAFAGCKAELQAG